jgi:dethiobiotin synthetase
LPLAPELAAHDADIVVELATITAAYARLQAQAAALVVEGVGGWAAPLSSTLDQAELVRTLGLPVVLVVGLRLGCLNHAYLSARAILADGCRLAGWIGCEVDPHMARRDDNLALLRARLPAPCWGFLPHREPLDAAALAACLDLPV